MLHLHEHNHVANYPCEAKACITDTLDLCQRKLFLTMRQGGILFYILEFIAHLIMMRQVFPNVYVIFGICE